MSLRFEIIKACHHEARSPEQVIERAEAYLNWITSGKPETDRPDPTAGKTAKVAADPKR